MVEVSLTVGKLDASLALLLTEDHHLIEFPTILLPNGVKAGSIVKIKCEQDFETEQQEAKQFQSIQDEILNTFGKNLPSNPVLKVKNVTQTSCVLEWEDLNLGTATLKNLFLYKGGKKLGAIPQPLTNKTTKLSGLPIDQTFEFQLKLDTTAGVYTSDILEVTTHKMTDLSGIKVCLGDISPNEAFTIDDIEETLKNMGAHYPAQTKVSVDTTHFICTRENKQNPEFIKANEMNIPIIRPEWLKACERDRRIVGVRDYYVKDCVLPDIFAKNFWNKSTAEPVNNKKDDTLPEIPEESPSQESPKVTSENNAEAPKITVEAPTDPEIQVTEATPESNSKVELKEEEASNGDLGNVKAEEEKVNEEVVEPVNEVSGEGEVSPEPKPKDTEEPAEATKAVDVVEEPVHPTEADVEEPVQPTEADIVEEPVQPTEADIVEEPVQSTKADVKEEPVQPTETDVKEEPVETSDAVADSINENRSSNDDSPKDEEPKEPSNEPKSETKSKNKNKKKKNKKK